MIKLLRHLVLRYPYTVRSTVKFTVGATTASYLGYRLYNWSCAYAEVMDALGELRTRFQCRNDETSKFNAIMYNTNIYPRPLMQVVPRTEDEFKNLLSICNQSGIAVAFWDKAEYAEGKIVKQAVHKPFIAVDLSLLNSIVHVVYSESNQ